MTPKLLVINVAGLAPQLLTESSQLATTRTALGSPVVTPIRPVFPAVTCTAQATYTTGRMPSDHGIVSNGLYDPPRRSVGFWEQSAGLIDVPRIWEKPPNPRTAYLFWWNGLHGSNDLFLNVAPFHFADGRTVSSCYSKPAGLYETIAQSLGPFPLHRFWGPMTSIESTAWIAGATKEVLTRDDLDLVFTYLPHLDYSQQKYGPNSDAVASDLAELDGVLSDLIAHAHRRDYQVLVLSEYGIGEVNGCVDLNRALRQQGWIATREAEQTELIDIGASQAFAMVDHQVAHIYTNRIDPKEVARFVHSLEGVETVLIGESLRDAGLEHPRSGSMVAVADPDKWFSYYWWLDPERAPDFAATIDIHRKPGFDPLEMFFDPATQTVPFDTALIKGSHGRVPDSPDQWAVALADFPLPSDPLEATQIFPLLQSLCR